MTKILIIDDSTFMRNILKDILQDEIKKISSFNTLEFFEADGKKNALEQFKKIKPDVIFLDIVMEESEMEGVEFLEAIKPSFDVSKVIIVSSIGQQEIISKCNELGVSSYLQKPIDNEKVIEAVAHIIK